MYKITKEIILDVNRNSIQDTIHIPQNTADAFCLAMHINQNGHELNLTDCIVQIKAVKPDGAEVYDACTVDGDTAYYTVTKQFAAVVGYVDCQVQIVNSDLVLYSPKFQGVVTEGVGLKSIDSSDEYAAFQTYMQNANTLIANAAANASLATTYAGFAVERANNAKSSELAAAEYADNAEGFSETAQQYKEAAESAKTDAETAKAGAESAKTDTEAARDEALTYKNAAASSADDAEKYARLAQSQKNSAAEAAGNAINFAYDAESSAAAAADSESAAGEYAATCSEKADICVEKAAELTNRIISQSDYDASTDLAEGIYFVRMGE